MPAQEALRLGAAGKPAEHRRGRRAARGAASSRGQRARRGSPETSNLPELVDWLGLLQQDGLNPCVRDVLGLIAAHYGERLSVEQTADALGISASYLSRKLKGRRTCLQLARDAPPPPRQSLALLRERGC